MPTPSHPKFTKLFKKLEQIKDDLNFELKLAKKSGEFITEFYISFTAYKRIKTKKRAIPLEYILEIERLNFPYESRFFRGSYLPAKIYDATGCTSHHGE